MIAVGGGGVVAVPNEQRSGFQRLMDFAGDVSRTCFSADSISAQCCVVRTQGGHVVPLSFRLSCSKRGIRDGVTAYLHFLSHTHTHTHTPSVSLLL